MPSDLTAAGLLLRRVTGQGPRWLLLKARHHREWGFPKGHQEADESLTATALRECAEESGIGLVALDGTRHELIYSVPDGRRKRVVYFGATTTCGVVTLSREHDEARWMDAEDVLRRLPHDSLRALFQAHRACLARHQ